MQAETDDAMGDRYRSLFENSLDAILIMEGDRFVDCNQAAADMLGVADTTAVLQTHPSDISPEYQPDGQRSDEKADAILAHILDQGGRYFEWLHVRADGTLLPVEVSMTAVQRADAVPQLHIVWRDLTSRKRLEKELHHAQRMQALGSLAAGVAHDFNNALVPIVAYSDLLETSLGDRPAQQNWAHEIGRAGALATSLVKKLMAVSRKESLPAQPVHVEVGATVEGALRIVRRLVGDDVTLAYEASPEQLWVRTEAGDLEQVLLNLASNARDAMPRGGTITIAVEHAERTGEAVARLSISDDGVGMDDATLARAFEPFFTTKQIGSGTGLGLASVREIVTRAGGTIDISSAVGAGTRLVLDLPVVVEPHVVDDASTAPPSGRIEGERPIVLVVEDNEQIRRMISEVLDRDGYDVHTASSGALALEITESVHPALVVTDVVMPHLSGPELVHQLRDRGIEPPVLFMSGYADDHLSGHGLDAGSCELLRKPFAAAELSEAVGRTLRATAG